MFYQFYLPFQAYFIPSTVYTFQLYIPILTDIDKISQMILTGCLYCSANLSQ